MSNNLTRRHKQPADGDVRVETPEGVNLAAPIADLGSRAVALLIDFLIIAVLFLLLSMLSMFGRTGEGVMLVLMFFVAWTYFIVTEMLMDGASPGKKAMSLRVVADDLTPITLEKSLIRNLFRFVDTFVPPFCGIGAVIMLANDGNKRIGDLAAGTLVIVEARRKRKTLRIEVEPIAPTLALTAKEQRAIVRFANYYEQGYHERANELASRLQPLFPTLSEAEILTNLRGYGRYIKGDE